MTNDKYLPDDDENFKKISMLIKESGRVKDNEIKTFRYKMWIFTHGLASLIATNAIKISKKEKEIVFDLIRGALSEVDVNFGAVKNAKKVNEIINQLKQEFESN